MTKPGPKPLTKEVLAARGSWLATATKHRKKSMSEYKLESTLRLLSYGSPGLSDTIGGDIQKLQAAWVLHGPTLLRQFIRRHPGCRPFGWWIFCHKQERPIVNSTSDDESLLRSVRDSHFGFAHGSTAIVQGGELVPWQQPQWQYLAEHKLLTKSERQMTDDELDNEAI
jgi:hypothetical protein